MSFLIKDPRRWIKVTLAAGAPLCPWRKGQVVRLDVPALGKVVCRVDDIEPGEEPGTWTLHLDRLVQYGGPYKGPRGG